MTSPPFARMAAMSAPKTESATGVLVSPFQ
jgi:hypothetical protein